MSINEERIKLFKADLEQAFTVLQLTIEDESHLHAGHAGAATGGGHFRLTIVAPEFDSHPPIARHRAIYSALDRHIPKEIHALTISALTPKEAGL
jgi:BolA family transcriptional regulator, general stress-responsive regulator